MTMRQFIKDYRPEIDTHIKSICGNCKLNDKERQDWIMNEEGLYNWARSEGVRC